MRGTNEKVLSGALAALFLACSGCAASGNRSGASEVGRPSYPTMGMGYGYGAAYGDSRLAFNGVEDFDEGEGEDGLGVRQRRSRRPRGGLPVPWAMPGGWAIPQGWSVPPGWPFPLPGPLPAPGKQRVPAPSVGAPAAVAYARSKLGVPYCWGGTGPTCYDCSGLTSASWKAGGKVIPRTSEEQAERLPEVPFDKIVPGDILWRPGHVALYVGDGQVIQAPHTGDVVKVSPAVRFTKAVRP